MNGTQLQMQKEALNQMLERLSAITVSCRTCEQFSGVRCLKYDSIPPAEVVAVGCDEWEFDGVPF
jgi:hypothetical protein